MPPVGYRDGSRPVAVGIPGHRAGAYPPPCRETAATHFTTPPRPGAGDRAPDFTLRHTFTEQVTLADRWRRGPVVLAFYVFDFGPA
jgi:AhpC/TSA family